MIVKTLQCLHCGHKLFHLEKLKSVNLICPQCESGWVYHSALNNEVQLKYKTIRTLKFRFDLLIEDAGGKYLVDIFFVFFFTFRLLDQINLAFFKIVLWLIRIITLRLLFQIVVNQSVTQVFQNVVKSIIDASPGFVILYLIGYFYHKFYLRSFSSMQLSIFSIGVALISSWLSIFLFVSHLKYLRDKKLFKTLILLLKEKIKSLRRSKVDLHL